jgi:hypothetical protein
MCADLTRAQELLNYRSMVSLDTGLRLTLERDARLKEAALAAS